MSEKKRKRETTSDRPSKKVATASSTRADAVKVSILEDADSWSPILASTPGLSLPSATPFKPYTKPRPQTSRSAPPTETLLHSPANSKLDYVAREDDTAEAGGLLKHYIGVYDPERGDLQLVPACKVTVRGTLRSAAAPKEEDGSQNALSARSTLGLTFGTKKSRKAILALTENAISPSKAAAKPSSQSKPSTLDPLASAVVDSMAATTADMPTREEMQAEINLSKPIPPPNLSAQNAEEVWTLESLVGLQTLRSVQVKEWVETIQNGDEITCKSRFVAHRIEKLVAANDVKSLRGLRYLLLLIEWYYSLKKGAKGVLRVPRKEDLQQILSSWPSELVDGVGRRFAEGGELNTWHKHNLLTHILALALVLDGCVTDTRDIRDDLRLDNKEISTLHSELACPLSPPTEAELKRLKMSKTEAVQSGHRFARLKLPLVFPRMRLVTKREGEEAISWGWGLGSEFSWE